MINLKKVILTILDGVGIREKEWGNAFKLANTPNFDNLWNNYPHSKLEASSTFVGLPVGQMGNSEVGHLNIGAGRIVYQPLQLMNAVIENGVFFNNVEILKTIDHVNSNNSKLHVMGLFSDGGVHSHKDHFMAILKLAKEKNIKRLYFHLITDGRDTLPNCSNKYIKELEDYIKEYNLGSISTISGRYYAMDRDNNWDRINKAYDVIVNSKGEIYNSAEELIKSNYDKGIYDEFIIPGIIDEEGSIEEGDGILWVNFRPDRAWEILSSITNNTFDKFDTKKLNNIRLTTMMPVADSVVNTYAFKLEELKNTLGEYLSKIGKRQLRIAETEKYAHVTYFFDGGIEKELPLCDRLLVPSPKVYTYDLKPEMSCHEITDKLLGILNNYDFVVLNYANGDMVGHTGVIDAAIKGIEAVDYNLGRLYNKAKELGFTMVIIADHGNCEEMLDESGNVLTAHTTNKVPCIITDNKYYLKDGKLGDVAPTVLNIMDIEIPKEMSGNSLISVV